MQIGSSRGNYIGMCNLVHIWSTYTFQYMTWCTHIWSQQLSAIGGSGVQKTFHSSSCSTYPQSDELAICGCRFNACPQTYPAS